MPNLEERLQAVVAQSEVDGSKWHTIVHGDDTTTVPTENGNVPSVAKQLKDVRAEIINGLEDYVGECRQAKADTLQIKSETQTIKGDTNTIKGQTKTLRDEAETFKDLSQTTYNSIASATAASISQVQAEGAVQVALATAQAERALAYAQSAAPTPLGTKLTIPASSRVPDGYEPVWYKNTITRDRYPDFFTQLVDTDSLTLVTEATYDSQVSTYGMCASYVKVDNNTLILPLLVNFARGGTPSQLGSVQNDQMQGHWHEMVYRQDSTSSGYRSDIFGSDGYTSGSYSNTGGTDEWMQRLGNRKNDALCAITPITDNTNGTPRVGSETRPKGYYELTYIKCADVSRTLAAEETTAIRTLLTQKLNVDFSNFTQLTANLRSIIVANCMPDYRSATTVSLPYTATKNGVFFYRGGNASNSLVKFSIDGFECWFNGYGTSNGGSFLVPKNSTVSITANPLSSPVFSFVPFKEV